ncbi:MAG: transporter permease [Chitinophagaceae bacterium]|nr:transporter permease [Chitinophagaceae bacterium]
MKLLHIFRFEFRCQLRTASVWLYFLVLLASSFMVITMNYADDARDGYILVNAPVVIGVVTVLSCVLWLLVGSSVAGHAATRDVQTRMHPLTYTAPVSKAEYLGGRFLAAFVINAVIMLAIPAGILIAVYLNELEPAIIGPFRSATYLASYFFIALPNAFFATAIQFSMAALKRSAMASFLAGGLLFFLAYILGSALNQSTQSSGYGNLVDPMSFSIMLNKLTIEFTPVQLNSAVISLKGPLLWNRLFWFCISFIALGCTYSRFRFAHPTAGSSWWKRRKVKRKIHHPALLPVSIGIVETTRVTVPTVRQRFGFAAQAKQTLTIAIVSFKQLAKSRVGIFFLAFIALLVFVIVPLKTDFLGVPMIPRTNHLLTFLTAPLTNAQTPWIIIPLLVMFYVGELVWRERDAGMSEITGAAPVQEWVLFTGKFLGLTFTLMVWLTLLMMTGILIQLNLGYNHFEIGQYLQTLFGIQLIDYLLFALLAFVVHVLVNQKYIAQLLILIAFGYITFAPTLGIENKLLIYGSDTGWSFSDINGFGPSLQTWLWFKLYWVAWALLLAVLANLLWVRSKESGFKSRLQLAMARFKGLTIWTTILAVSLIISVGGFIFYNTHVLNEYDSTSERIAKSVDYEKQFIRFEHLPQATVVGTKLWVNIYPKQTKATITGTYQLVNNSAVPIDSILLSTVSGVSTHRIVFDRQAKLLTSRNNAADMVYVLANALQPGDSMHINFSVDFAQRGFSNSGAGSYVLANGTYFTNRHLLPVVGFQAYRCISDVSLRKKHGLAPRPLMPSLYNVEARYNLYQADQTNFEAIVSTDADQVAVAPGRLQRTWAKDGRRYFHYVTNAPIPNQYAFFSAKYAVHEVKWNNVTVQVFHQRDHRANLKSMLDGARSALAYYTKQFGPYPYDVFRLVEHPGYGSGMHAEATTIDFEEGFSLLNPIDKDAYDLPFYIVAHETAHQWWGAAQLLPARVEGAFVLTEAFAVYTGMQVLEEKYGNECLQRYLTQIRKTYEIPRTKAAVPLLRASDQYQGYRKGPFALYALSKYINKERVNGALKQLLAKHGSGKPPLPTTLDLYRELKAITPDTLQYLLHDLFEVNTYWDLKTDNVTAQPTKDGNWQVTLRVQARKDIIDEMGNETRVPMSDWIEIGVFSAPEKGKELDKVLYLQKHRIRTGQQTITLTVPNKPTRAGIDPNNLLIDLKVNDNSKIVKLEN